MLSVPAENTRFEAFIANRIKTTAAILLVDKIAREQRLGEWREASQFGTQQERDDTWSAYMVAYSQVEESRFAWNCARF